MNELKFETKERDFIKLGNSSHNIRLSHKIAPSSFIEMFERIATRFHFSITKDFYERISVIDRTFRGKKRKALVFDVLRYIVDFFINCNILLAKGIDIDRLIKEFLNSGDQNEFNHSCSLSYLTSTYALNGYTKIRFLGRPDFEISQVPAEVKVIQQPDYDKIFDEKGVNVFTSYLYKDICYDIGQAIRNRLVEGIKQSAEIVFVDLSAKSLMSLYASENFDSITNIIPEPKKFRIVFFCRIGPNVFIGREGTYSLFGTYVDFDPNIWNIIKQSERTRRFSREKGTTKIPPYKQNIPRI